MDDYEKLKLLTSQMHLEPAEDAICIQLSKRKQDKISVSDAVLPNGKRISLLKSQLSQFVNEIAIIAHFGLDEIFNAPHLDRKNLPGFLCLYIDPTSLRVFS